MIRPFPNARDGIDLAPNSAECIFGCHLFLLWQGDPRRQSDMPNRRCVSIPISELVDSAVGPVSILCRAGIEEAIGAYRKVSECFTQDLLTPSALQQPIAGQVPMKSPCTGREIFEMNPNSPWKERAKFIPPRTRADLDRYLDGLRKLDCRQAARGKANPGRWPCPAHVPLLRGSLCQHE